MKFIFFYEVNKDSFQEWLKIQPKYAEEIRNEAKYGKRIANYGYETFKGISVLEFDNDKQLYNRIALSMPYITIKPVHCIDGALAREVRAEIGKLKASW